MNNLYIKPISHSFNLAIDDIASDKSISHRSAIFSMYCLGTCVIKNYLMGEDTLNTLNIMKSLGATVEVAKNIIKITPPEKIIEPENVLECGNSGTAIRLLSGFLASLTDRLFILNGDLSIRKRPMSRVIKPLNENGANILGRGANTLAPMVISGTNANGFYHKMTVSSAQVKSALILYALSAKTQSIIDEPKLSRNHTEIMLQKMGADIQTTINDSSQKIVINPLTHKLKAFDITIPSDPSSGFFFAIAVCLIKDSQITLKNILLNDTRIEAYKILQQMGADISFVKTDDNYEPVGDITIKHSKLKAVHINKNIAWLIDEVPALSIAFAIADGVSIITNAKELRHKESDRISSTVNNLKLCGVAVKELEDGFEVTGQDISVYQEKSSKKVAINSYKDHRIAMSFAIFGLIRNIEIIDIACIKTSFPNFTSLIDKITGVKK